MFGRRLVLCVILSVATNATARAQTCDLTEGPLVDSICRVELKMLFDGEIKVRQDAKDLVLKQSAEATHEFVERGLEMGPGNLLQRAARFYKVAQARLAIESAPRTLRPERALVIAQRVHDQLTVYALAGLFTREEFELTEHFDTLALPGVLPGKSTSVGETWKISNAAAQALCELDGLSAHDLVGKLESVKDGVANIGINGTASGIDLGAAVKIQVAATAAFDIKARRIASLDWKQHEERDQGPVSPALKAEVRTTVKRTPIAAADEVHDFALVKMPDKGKPPVEEMTQIQYADARGRFVLNYNRDWHLVGRTEDNVVLRLMDRGDFVAQVTVTAWKNADPGQHASPAEFKAAMAATPGWKQEKLEDEQEIKSDSKYWIYRLAAAGQFDGEEAVQYFYLVAGPDGDQTVLTFTMTPKQAQKLESRDVTLLRGLSYSSVQAPTSK
jgi:hypothetical protein